MKLSSSFPVPGSPDKVLTLFLDPSIMQQCLPGCEELAQVDENTYRGALVNEVSHVKFRATFSAEITERDIPSDTSSPAQVRAVLKGEDRRLGSTVKLDALLVVAPSASGEGSEVSYEIEMAMWGKLGRLGESVIRRRTAEVETQFAEALAAVCAGKPVPVRSARPGKRAPRQAPAGVLGAGTSAAASGTAPSAADAGVSAAVGAPPARSSQDWAVLALAVVAAFGYGIIAGGRRRDRR